MAGIGMVEVPLEEEIEVDYPLGECEDASITAPYTASETLNEPIVAPSEQLDLAPLKPARPKALASWPERKVPSAATPDANEPAPEPWLGDIAAQQPWLNQMASPFSNGAAFGPHRRGGLDINSDDDDDEELRTLRARSRSPAPATASRIMASGKCAGLNSRWDARSIAAAVESFVLTKRRRPHGLEVDAEGRFVLEDLMEVWGQKEGLKSADVLDALRKNMFYTENGAPVLRFTLTGNEDDEVIVRVLPPKNGCTDTFKNVSAPGKTKQRATTMAKRNDSCTAGYSWDTPSVTKTQLRMLEQPRFFKMKEGAKFCILCGQWSDERHILGKKHVKRAAHPEWYMPEPELAAKVEVIDLEDDEPMGTVKAETRTVARPVQQVHPTATQELALPVEPCPANTSALALRHSKGGKAPDQMSREELIARVNQLETARKLAADALLYQDMVGEPDDEPESTMQHLALEDEHLRGTATEMDESAMGD